MIDGQPGDFFASILFLVPLIIVALSTLIFAGITLIIQTFIKTSADQHIVQTPKVDQTSYNINKRKMLKIALLLLIICIIPLFLNYGKEWFFGSDSDTSIILISVNKSEAQTGNIIHLTEKDFKEFPRLASVIRDNEQKNLVEWPGGKEAYWIRHTEQERYRFIALYWSNYSGLESRRSFEYNEKYFNYNYPPMS
jgi:hypothetical protein